MAGPQGIVLALEILDKDDQQPVPGVIVRVGDTDVPAQQAGAVRIDTLVPGKNILQVRAPGFVPATVVQRFDEAT